MWSEILNESRSQRKFDNRPLVILGSRHSGKRSLIDSLFDISKTTMYAKKHHPTTDKMRLHGVTTAIDYAYLNVVDMLDPDNRTPHAMQAPTPN
jgi:signal recognition particle receptor subunit beta